MEAADKGNTAHLLRLLARLEHQCPFCPAERADMAARLVFMACEFGHPDTAEAAMRHYRLSAAQLVFIDGRPLADFAREEGFDAVGAFLRAQVPDSARKLDAKHTKQA